MSEVEGANWKYPFQVKLAQFQRKLFITFFIHEPRLPATPRCITPAITAVGHLITWRRSHGILWLYKS